MNTTLNKDFENHVKQVLSRSEDDIAQSLKDALLRFESVQDEINSLNNAFGDIALYCRYQLKLTQDIRLMEVSLALKYAHKILRAADATFTTGMLEDVVQNPGAREALLQMALAQGVMEQLGRQFGFDPDATEDAGDGAIVTTPGDVNVPPSKPEADLSAMSGEEE